MAAMQGFGGWLRGMESQLMKMQTKIFWCPKTFRIQRNENLLDENPKDTKIFWIQRYCTKTFLPKDKRYENLLIPKVRKPFGSGQKIAGRNNIRILRLKLEMKSTMSASTGQQLRSINNSMATTEQQHR